MANNSADPNERAKCGEFRFKEGKNCSSYTHGGRQIAYLDYNPSNVAQLYESPQFAKIPASVLIEIMDSCDLVVNSEIEVVNMIVKWLRGRDDRLLYAAALFQSVRWVRMTDGDRQTTMTKASELPQGKQLSTILKVVIGDLGNWRVCALASHHGHGRCGKLPSSVRDSTLSVQNNFVDPALYAQCNQLTATTSEAQLFSIAKSEAPRPSTRVERRALREKQQDRDQQGALRILRKLSPAKKSS